MSTTFSRANFNFLSTIFFNIIQDKNTNNIIKNRITKINIVVSVFKKPINHYYVDNVGDYNDDIVMLEVEKIINK